MKSRRHFVDDLRALVGALFLAGGVALFLAPNEITTGGAPGMAILLNHLTGAPIGLLMLGINAVLLAAGAKSFGKVFLLRSIVVMGVSSFLIDLFREVLALAPPSHNPLLATVYGGIAVGIGVGLILRSNASAGGTSVLARVVSEKTHLTPGQILLASDFVIIALSAVVFSGIESALWSLLSIYATSKCVDLVLTGRPSEKIVHISTKRVDLVRREISERLGYFGTILTGTGLDKKEPKTLILLTLEARRIASLREIIRQNDPEALLIVMDAAELLGRGHGV